MQDKNGIEIKTGAIAEISGAYFKNDNGLYFVENSPGDPSTRRKDIYLDWFGSLSAARAHVEEARLA